MTSFCNSNLGPLPSCLGIQALNCPDLETIPIDFWTSLTISVLRQEHWIEIPYRLENTGTKRFYFKLFLPLKGRNRQIARYCRLKYSDSLSKYLSVANPGFLRREGDANSWIWAKNYYLARFLMNTAWKWKKLDWEGALIPESANTHWNYVGQNFICEISATNLGSDVHIRRTLKIISLSTHYTWNFIFCSGLVNSYICCR